MNTSIPKYSKWLLWGCWTIIFTLSIVFCWERVLYQDSAYALFKVLNLQNTVEHGRFIVPLILAPGYLFSFISLPIPWVILGISLSNPIWGVVLTYYFFRKSNYSIWTWSPALILLCTGPDFFFLGFAEMIPALFLTIWFAFELTHKNSWSFLILPLAFFAHPGVLPALLVIACIQLLSNTRNFKNWIPFLGLFALVGLKTMVFQNSEYEQGIMDQVNFKDLKSFSQSWGFDYFLSSFKTWLMPVAIMGLAILGSPKFKNIMSFAVLAFFTLFIVYVYRNGDSNLMMQKSYAPMLAMAFSGFAMNHIPKVPSKWVFLTFTFFCILGGYFRVSEGEFYRNRLKALDQKIISAGPGKYFTLSETFPPEKYRVNWAIPYESIIRSSALYGANKTTTFSYIDSSTYVNLSKLNSKERGLGQFKGADFTYPLSYRKLRPRYFQLDSFSDYKKLQHP